MNRIAQIIHWNGIRNTWHHFLVNNIYIGARFFERKRKLLNAIGCEIDEGTKIVGPIECHGKLIIGKN